MYDKFYGYNHRPTTTKIREHFEQGRIFVFDPFMKVTLTPLAKYKGHKNPQRHRNFR